MIRFPILVIWLLGMNAAAAEQKPADVRYPILSGIGAALKNDNGHYYVMKLVPKSAAAVSNSISVGDQLVAAKIGDDFVALEGKTLGDVVSLLRGPVGTTVVVRILRKGTNKPVDVSLKRQPLQLFGDDTSYEERIGTEIPDLELTDLSNSKKKVRIKDFLGRVVVLDFWASWCGACYAPVDKLQHLKDANRRWGDDVELIAVAVDDNLASAQKVVEKRKWTKTEHFAIDMDSLSKIGVRVIPVIIIISPDGKIAAMAGAHSLSVEERVNSILGSNTPVERSDVRKSVNSDEVAS